MQTFVPIASPVASARALDRQRLGKQRVEVLQILRALTGQTAGWRNHPATRMWEGHRAALVRYGVAVCDEWIERGYNDTCRAQIMEFGYHPQSLVPWPEWWGGPIHASHRAALLAKAPEHYNQFGWTEAPCVDYVWPKGAA